MENMEIFKNKYAEKIYMNTPNGGDYIVIYYFDENDNYTTKENAYKLIVKEYKYDETVVNEKFFIMKK